MLGRLYENQDCAMSRALEVVGERWSLLILRDALFRGMTRFSEFQRSLGLAPNILSARLSGFCQSGLMEVDAAAGSDQPRYRVTDKARDLAVVIVALTAWGDRWAAPEGPPVAFVHRGCDGLLQFKPVCGDCGNDVPPEELEARPRPGSSWARPA